ncbi:MAG: phosphatase PAP2 family protein [Deltaproteobacteria bacterium]|nr:phosphatase PAP2 family protein [Deltaproteobacteria bacterium]
MDSLIRFDAEIFRLINMRLASGYLDIVMPYVTEKFNFLGAIIVAALLIMILGNKRDRIGLVVLVALVLLSDLASNLLKQVFLRVRPCNALDGVRLLVGCSGSYSLPSGHATNIFAAMVFLTLRYKRFFLLFLAIAVTVSYSRVYVGVHYPFDVFSGAILGSLMAYAFTFAEKRFFKDKLKKALENPEDDRGSFEA